MLAFELRCEPAGGIESLASEVLEGSLEAWFQAFMLAFELCCEPAGCIESPASESLEGSLEAWFQAFMLVGQGRSG